MSTKAGPTKLQGSSWSLYKLCFLFLIQSNHKFIIFFKGPRKCLKSSHFAKCYIIPNFCVM